MPFQIYSTLTKVKAPFEPIEPGKVRMYNCGPTVYGRAHIGNMRAFVFADLVRRWLEHEGFEVRQIMNITDVGHLVDDADDGEDKLIAQAKKEGRDPWKISAEHAAQFFLDLEALGCSKAAVYPRATDHIEEMLEMIDGLMEKGYAYRAGDNVYFDVSKFELYGRLSGNRVEDLESGSRVEVLEEKRSPVDFALWKSDSQHLMKWDTRYGPDGFPGWHIECSAMARKHLGDRIDIHTGGEDNVFPHHECEIAQSEAFTGEPFSTYWMHSKFLQVDGGKMSKSLGNVYNLDDIVEHGFEVRALRYTLLRGHYRQPLNFTWAVMTDSAKALEKLDDLVQRLRRAVEGQSAADDPEAGRELLSGARAEFVEAMNDDLNTPRALAALHPMRDHVLAARFGSSVAREVLEFLLEVQGVLGFPSLEQESDLDSEIDALIQERIEARASRDFARSDEIRDQLLAQGILLEDTAEGTLWRRK